MLKIKTNKKKKGMRKKKNIRQIKGKWDEMSLIYRQSGW